MPLTRYQIRNEYSLADPELYKAADRDDPEALLEGVAMAGLIGVLRQLGDLAEFAAEIFHDLHEEVMSTAARGHGLMVRVQQLEAEFPSIEKAFLSQTNHSTFFSNAGVDWHPNLQMKQNLITGGDLPRCVMDSYEECRGPPRLFLLDKFDVAGAGACLKRYTDPSLFKVEVAPSGIPSMEVQREKRMRKVKKKGSRWRNGETPETIPTSHAKLHELFLEETIEKNYANPARLVKLKKRQLNASPFDPRSGKSYMEKFLESPTENNVVREISVTPLALKLASDNSSESGPEIHDISTVSPVKKSSQGKESTPPNPRELVLNSSIDESYKEVIDGRTMDAPGLLAHGETDETSSHNVTVEKDIAVDGTGQSDRCLERDRSDDMTSEVDNYVDALTSVESEMETDNEYRSRTGHGYLSVGRRGEDSTRNEEQMDSQVNSWDSRSIGNFSASDDGSSSFKKERSSFSYSDTPSNLVESTHSDGERASAHVVPSETSMCEIMEMPSNQLPATMQILRTNPHDLELLNNGCVDEDNCHGLAEESSNYCAKDSSLLRSDPAASLELHRVDETLQQHTYNEKHSVCTISGSELASINEDVTDLVDSSTVTDMALLRTKDDALSTACAGHPVDRSDGEHPDVTSETLLNNSNNLELAPEKINCDDSVGEELHSDFAGEKCMENMVHDRTRNINSSLSTSTATEEQFINSSLSTSTATEEQSHFSAASESETQVDVRSLPDSTVVMNSDKSVSHLDEASWITGIYVKNLMSMDDASETLKGELLSDTAENLPPVELDSTEKEVVYSMGDVNPDTTGTAACVGLESTEKPLPYLEEVADLEDGEKIGFLTCKVDKVEEDDVPLELPSSSPACSALEDNVGIDQVVAVSVHTEKTVVSATTAATASLMTAGTGDKDYTDVICQPPTLIGSQSGDLVKMPESSVMENQHQEEPEVSELFLSESFRASEETEKDQLKVVPSVLPSTSFKLVSNEDSNVEMVDGTQESSVAHTPEIYLHAGDINIASASSELEATSSLTAHHLPDPETSSEQLLELQASQSGIEDLKTDQTNSKWSDDLYRIAPQRCYDDASESYIGISSEVLPSEVLELQADQSGMQNLKTDHANAKLSDDLYHIAQERCYSDASESYGGFSRQLLPSQHLKLSTLEQFNSSGQALSPTSPVLPSNDMFHEAPQVSLEEMPPLPPLPPMQWRLGKIQPAPPVSEKEFIKQSQEPIPSASPLKHDEQTQFGYPDPQRGIAQPWSQVAAAEVEKSENESETVVGNIMQHNVSSSQLPTDASSEQKNPSLESLELSDEKPEHGFSALESEVVPSSSNPFLPAATHIECYNLKDDTISLQGSEVQPPSKITLETGLLGKVLENTSQSLEQEQGNTSDPSVSPTKEVEEQSQHGLLTSEEEPAWTSNPFGLLPTSEAGLPNGSSKTKIPRPRNPLIDAVAAHDKSKLRKVTERVLPQSEPKVDERDSLLEQIRTKSFNLKPAVVSRPSMPGPTPNLKLAAILEKANAIRHATAGSDEDSDSWSDS